jgi:hypothetical protein
VTVAYVPGRAAALGPRGDAAELRARIEGDSACELVVHHRRARKTGPQILVTLVHCQTHRRAFTLYPLGHVPYGRVAVAPVGLDGEVLFSMEGESLADGKRSPAWRATRFGPAFAAIHDPTVKLTDPRWWVTETPERLAPDQDETPALGVHGCGLGHDSGRTHLVLEPVAVLCRLVGITPAAQAPPGPLRAGCSDRPAKRAQSSARVTLPTVWSVAPTITNCHQLTNYPVVHKSDMYDTSHEYDISS